LAFALRSGDVSLVGHALITFHVITGAWFSSSRLMMMSRRWILLSAISFTQL